MSDSQPPMQDWNAFAEQWNEQFLEALEDNMEAQAQFVESWSETVGEASDDTEISDGVEGYARAYETWMTASQQMVERANDQLEGEDVDIEEFRDIWLNTANEAFKGGHVDDRLRQDDRRDRRRRPRASGTGRRGRPGDAQLAGLCDRRRCRRNR